MSRSIQALEKVGLVECLTPDEKMDRYYRISETGKKVVAIIEGKGEYFFGWSPGLLAGASPGKVPDSIRVNDQGTCAA